MATARAAPAANVRIKVHLYSTTAMPPTWSPDGRHLLVPALPVDEADADPRPPRARATTATGHKRAGPGVLVLASGAEPAPPAATRTETFSHYDSVVDLTAIAIADGTAESFCRRRCPAGPGPPSPATPRPAALLAYVSCMRPGPKVKGVVEDVLDLGVVRVGESEPLYVEEISRSYEGYESYSGDHLGRSCVILAWHPTDDVLVYLNGHQLRRLQCTEDTKPRASAARPRLGQIERRLPGLRARQPCGARRPDAPGRRSR